MISPPKDKLKELRENLIKDNYDLPDYETFKKDLSDDKKLKQLRENLIKEARDSGFLSPEMVMQTATNKYARLGGEAEARLIQSRRDMTKEELAAQPAFDPKYFKEKTGIDIEDLIFQGLLGK